MKRLHALTASALLAFGILSTPALATCFLRQSDAAEIPLGQFVDATDGVTAETGLTLTQADIILKKCNAAGDCGAMAQKNETGGCAHDSLGVYECDLDATDTNTVGMLFVYVNESGALTERLVCEVVEEAVYDADFGSGATGQRPANVLQFNGSNVISSSGRPEVNTTVLAGSSLATLTGPYPALGIVESGTAQGATASTFTFRSGASFPDNDPRGWTCNIIGGTTGVGESFTISTYVGATDTVSALTMGTSSTFNTTPTGTILYACYGTSASASSALDAAGIRAALGFASANADTQFSGIQSDTNDLQTRVPAALVSGRMDSSTGAMAAGVLTNAAIANDAINDAKVASDVTIASVTGAVGSVTGGVGGSVAGSVGSVASNGITAASIATNAITADKLSSDVTTEITTGIPNSIRDLVIEDQGGGITLGCALAIAAAYAAGDLVTSAGTSTYEDSTGNETRIAGSVSSPGNRAATITCPTY